MNNPLIKVSKDGTINVPDGARVPARMVEIAQAIADSAGVREIVEDRDRLRAALKLYGDAELTVDLVQCVEDLVRVTRYPVGTMYLVECATMERLRATVRRLME